jgi:hypothetical protein
VLLALRRLRERHSGTYEASILAEVVQEYDFVDELGVCVADNAGDNDTAVRSLFNNLAPEVKDLTGKRVRCLAHIVNLAAKAFLYKADAEAFEAEARRLEDDDFDTTNLEAAQRIWRKQGPLGKLHNLVVFIKSSATRQEEFKGIRISDASVDNLNVLLDNQTRWNSQYFSISQALKLKERIVIF